MYLGFDLSTQGIKAILVSEDLELQHESSVSFDKDLTHFGTTDGVHRHADGKTVTSPVLLWVEAIDILLGKIKDSGIDFASIKALSASGQQHGTVYWRIGAQKVLMNLESTRGLKEQLQNSFAVENCPIWMDASTTSYCRNLEEAFGGAFELAQVTGSCAYERFSGNQIAKIYDKQREAYDNCEEISLVSSFLMSLFLGRYAPIDQSDGSGMNLLNIVTKQWESKALNACAPQLDQHLMSPVPSSTVLGHVSAYMVGRYGFSPECGVVAATGDNPSSLAGMCLHQGDIAVSLGTSDTLILWTEDAHPALEGHVFINPVNENQYMALLCFKNGSLARERVRDAAGCYSWEEFNNLLGKTKPGNDGNIGVYFFDTEIIPFAQGIHRWDVDGTRVQSFSSEVEVRAVIEGQFMAKRIHAEKIGYCIDEKTKILATGGASKNTAILQILADVFNSRVYVSSRTSNSACLGAAYRAKHALLNTTKLTSFQEVVRQVADFNLIATPDPGSHAVYNDLCKRYSKLEGDVIGSS